MTPLQREAVEALRKAFATWLDGDRRLIAVNIRLCTAIEKVLALDTREAVGEAVGPIESADAMARHYIPLPGGWEVQTKGSGSTFRLVDTKTGDRLAIPDAPYLHETIERMAREVHSAAAPRDEAMTRQFLCQAYAMGQRWMEATTQGNHAEAGKVSERFTALAETMVSRSQRLAAQESSHE